MKHTVSSIRAHNAAAGKHFFDAKTIKFFKSRVESVAYNTPGGAYFVTSENFTPNTNAGARVFNIRIYDAATGEVKTAPETRSYSDVDTARIIARNLARVANS